MILLLPFILALIPAILLALNLSVVTPTNVDYSNMASNKAMSAYYQTGTAPTTTTVMGATVSVGVVDTSDLAYQDLDNLTWKRINAEQALLTACNQIMTMCNTANLSDLWSFLPSNSDSVQSLLSQTNTSNMITCGTPSTYAPYALYTLQHALASSDLSHTVGQRTYALYYSKPTAGTGCFFQDIVYAQ